MKVRCTQMTEIRPSHAVLSNLSVNRVVPIITEQFCEIDASSDQVILGIGSHGNFAMKMEELNNLYKCIGNCLGRH
jgi:hypothetical protein